MIHVGRLAPKDQWDQNMLDRLFTNTLYPTGLEFQLHTGYPSGDVDGCVMLIPGRYWAEQANQISEALSRYQWVLGIRSGDEEDLFDPYQIVHSNIKWWLQTPKTGHTHDGRVIGIGFPPHFNDLPAEPPKKAFDVFLSAQRTHARRVECFHAIRYTPPNSVVQPTKGFTQGMDTDSYRKHMVHAKVAPAPSGAVSPDSFRLWEALEAHCVPIADDISPAYDSAGFWDMVCPAAPFPTLTNYTDLVGYIEDQLEAWPTNANRITAWYMRYKRQLVQWLRDDLQALGAF